MRPTSDAPCRRPAPAIGSLDRPPARASRAALELTRSVSPGDQDRSTVSSLRGAISSFTRRWRNDPRRLLSCRFACLPPQMHVAFQPRTPDASRRSDRTSRHAFPVTFEHDACAPFRSGTGLTQRLCGGLHAPRDALSHRPSRSIRFGDGCYCLRVSGPAACDGLAPLLRPALRQYAE